jgi:hypothetical protein
MGPAVTIRADGSFWLMLQSLKLFCVSPFVRWTAISAKGFDLAPMSVG